jgi:hypothetical protein
MESSMRARCFNISQRSIGVLTISDQLIPSASDPFMIRAPAAALDIRDARNIECSRPETVFYGLAANTDHQ